MKALDHRRQHLDLSEEVNMRPLYPVGIFIIHGIMCNIS
jgi:hypothetical protein